MPMTFTDTEAVLADVCDVAEAEPLLVWLQAHPLGRVDVGHCRHVHTAVLQVLMAAQPPLLGAVDATLDRPWLAALHGAAGD